MKGINTIIVALSLIGCGDKSADDTASSAQEPDALTPGTWYADADGDQFGDAATAMESAEQPLGYVASAGDCDDTNRDIFPGAVEVCDGVDDDCDALIDEGYPDTDVDGVADCVDVEDCDGLDNDGDGHVDEGFADADGDGVADCVDVEDCDGVDNDGDGEVDEGFDADGDGYTACGLDCDDGDAAIHPDAEEIADDAIDNDCDLLVDEGLWAPGDLAITEVMVNPWDVADRYGEWFELKNLSGRTVYLNGLVLSSGDESVTVDPDGLTALEPEAYVVFGRDAYTFENGGVSVDVQYDRLSLSNESGDLSVWADGVELDALSWDDGATMPDEAGAALSVDPWFEDAEGNDAADAWCAAPDTWGSGTDRGSPGLANPYCPTLDHDGDGFSQDAGDCDDDDGAVCPGAVESWYDGVDQDCDGWSDFDADFDGYTSSAWGGTDCDDTSAAVHPDLPEVCDPANVDEDCNGLADDDDPGLTDAYEWWPDSDGDGSGDPTGASIFSCEPTSAYAGDDLDCDDHDAQVNPAAEEVCGDGIDNDCDESTNGCGPEGELSLADQVTVAALAAGDQLSTVAAAGDMDGDGLDDLWVGVPYDDTVATDAGVVYLLSGMPADGSDLSAAVGSIRADRASANLSLVSGGQDLNADGYLDVVLGLPEDRTGGAGSGAMYVLYGPISGDLNLSSADVTVLGDAVNQQSATALVMGEDLDGDGLSDVLIGAPGDTTGGRAAGAVYLLSGPASAASSISDLSTLLVGASIADQAGGAVAVCGDVNGDGLADVLVGAAASSSLALNAGAAYVWHGPLSGELDLGAADAQLLGEERDEGAGSAVAGAGDVDGDGYDDVLVAASAYGPGDRGAVYLFSGTVAGEQSVTDALAMIIGAATGDGLGGSVAGLGDVNGDGFDDLAAGALRAAGDESGAGAAYVGLGPVSGSLDATDLDAVLWGESQRDQAGRAVCGVGDLDADGFAEIAVTAPLQAAGGLDAGALYIVLGGPGY